MRNDWKVYFNFSKKDRIAAIVLLTLIALVILIVFFYNPSNNQTVAITTLDQELAKQGIETTSNTDEVLVDEPSEETKVNNSKASELFQFDPNTLNVAGFKQLGLQDKT